MTRARIACALGAVAAAAIVAGCGSQGVSVSQSDPTHKGAELFATHCSGCHTLAVAGTMGSATKVRDRERVDGPNFNTRHETVDNVLYAIRNGGFSGAIMPENIVLGKDAQAVAQFLAKYAGRQSPKTSGP
jgi:mono/diheme cytochrome c family protein